MMVTLPALGQDQRQAALLQALPETTDTLGIRDCPGLTAGALQRLSELTQLTSLALHGVPPDLISDTDQNSPDVSGLSLQALPEPLRELHISGPGTPPEQPPPPRRYNGDGLFVSVRHVTATTLGCFLCLADRVRELFVGDCPEMTASGLGQIKMLTWLDVLTLRGMPHDLISDTEQNSPEVSGLSLQMLPESLRELHISGPGTPPEQPPPPRRYCCDLFVSVRHVTDATLERITCLADRLEELSIVDCPEMTARGVKHLSRLTRLKFLTLHSVPAEGVEHLGRLTGLQYLSLHGVPPGGAEHLSRLTGLEHITLSGLPTDSSDAILAALCSCSGLSCLELGSPVLPPEPDVTAAAVSRLAVACRGLWRLSVHTSVANSQAVLGTLAEKTDLGCTSAGLRRTIQLCVPEPVCRQLRRPPSRRPVKLCEWKNC